MGSNISRHTHFLFHRLGNKWLVWRLFDVTLPLGRWEADVTLSAEEWMACAIKIHEENWGKGEDWPGEQATTRLLFLSSRPGVTPWACAPFWGTLGRYFAALSRAPCEMLCYVRLSWLFEHTERDNCTVSQPSGLEWKSAIFCLTTPGSRATGK